MDDKNIRHFRVVGIDCAEEVAVLKRELGPLVGGEERLAFDVLRGRLTLSAEASDVDARQVMDAVARTGMRAERWSEESSNAARTGLWQRWGRSALTALRGLAIVVAVALHAWLTGNVAAAVAGSSLAPHVGNHSAEHFVFAGDQGALRWTDVLRDGISVGRDCGRHGSIVARHLQWLSAAPSGQCEYAGLSSNGGKLAILAKSKGLSAGN